MEFPNFSQNPVIRRVPILFTIMALPVIAGAGCGPPTSSAESARSSVASEHNETTTRDTLASGVGANTSEHESETVAEKANQSLAYVVIKIIRDEWPYGAYLYVDVYSDHQARYDLRSVTGQKGFARSNLRFGGVGDPAWEFPKAVLDVLAKDYSNTIVINAVDSGKVYELGRVALDEFAGSERIEGAIGSYGKGAFDVTWRHHGN